MREFKNFIKKLEELQFEVVTLSEVGQEDFEVIELDDLKDRVERLGVKNIIARYFESFEFKTIDGKYIEISGVC